DGGGAVAPALADIRAHGLLAHRRQAMLVHILLHRLVLRPGGQAHAQPVRLAPDRHGAVLAARLHAVLDRPRAVQLADLAPGNHRNALELLAHDRFLVTKSTRIITA